MLANVLQFADQMQILQDAALHLRPQEETALAAAESHSLTHLGKSKSAASASAFES